MFNPLKKIKICFSTAILAVVLSLFSHCALATVRCTSTGGGDNLTQTVKIDKPVNISTANLAPGTTVWDSGIINVQLRCTANYEHLNSSVKVWINVNPLHQIEGIDPSLQVVLIYNGTENALFSTYAIATPYTIWCSSTCPPIDFNLSFKLLIKTTGKKPPTSGGINDNFPHALFNLALAYDNDAYNFRVYLSGLNNINFVSCKPQINVVANNGASVDFGPVQSHNAQAGKTEKQVQFSVEANLTNAGQDCQGKAMNVSFSTTGPTNGGDMILPSNDSGFGFSVSPVNDKNKFIPLNTGVPLGYVNGSVVKNDFVASLRWLNNSPKIGFSSASANVDVTFK